MIAEKLFRESDLGPFNIAGCTDCELFKILNKFQRKYSVSDTQYNVGDIESLKTDFVRGPNGQLGLVRF